MVLTHHRWLQGRVLVACAQDWVVARGRLDASWRQAATADSDAHAPLLLPSLAGAQAKKLEEIRSEAQAELGIVDVLPVHGLGADLPPLPGALPAMGGAAARPAEEELFPAFKSNDASW